MSCEHHWEIETATGPTSRAVCKKCGGRQVFSNRLVCKRVSSLNSWVAPDWQGVKKLTEASALLREQQILT